MDRAASGRKPDGKSGIREVKVERRPKVCYTPEEWEYVKGMTFQKKKERGLRMKKGNEGYFEAALFDFVFDVAAGGAIRHLTDRGYSVEQIMRELSYPAPRAKVEKAVYRYLTDSRILLTKLPGESGTPGIRCLRGEKGTDFSQRLTDAVVESGEKNAYMECPFGGWRKTNEKLFAQTIACLTGREQEYLLGIRWERDVMYHRLNDRMREIALKLVKNTEWEWKFYFLG